ncbi:MAG: hypothetical protein M0R51_17260 [Clostridia bacterium]|jgi:flagellar biosynthesis protein FliQ|nr:hypothetical protein [Clostridia bacterium]
MIDIAIVSGMVISLITEITKLFPGIAQNKTAQRLICLGLVLVVTLFYALTDVESVTEDGVQFAALVLGTAFLTYKTILKTVFK